MVKVLSQNVEVIVNGKPIKIYGHNGRLFVEAREEVEYQIRLKNDDACRVLAVVSVDGLDVIKGDIATENSPGYILNGKSAYTVKGFRTSNDKVHPFIFSKKDESYAALSEVTSGSTADCGVIGAKFFYEISKKCDLKDLMDKVDKLEKDKPYIPYPIYIRPEPCYPWKEPYTWYSCGGATTSDVKTDGMSYTFNSNNVGDVIGDIKKCCSSQYACDTTIHEPLTNYVVTEDLTFDMGTKFSKKEVEDKVHEEKFEMGQLSCFIEVFYASREVLKKMGVQFDNEPKISFPSSFSSSGSKYCKLPKDRK